MTYVIGGADVDPESSPLAGKLGRFRARDGSEGAPLYFDCNRPHAILVVGKRGYGKSYTLGVLAEELARCHPIAPVLVDPMGVFRSMAEAASGGRVPATVVDDPRVRPDSLDPLSWCALVGLDPERAAGGLLWQAAEAESTLPAMREHVESATASDAAKRAAVNHLLLAASWDVFDASEGLDARSLGGPELTIVDVSGLGAAPMNAVARGVAESLYRARVSDSIDRLPWLLLDEAHAFFDGVAGDALKRIVTRGRAPGVSLVLVTQRPSAVPEVAISQSDVLVSHRLTARADVEALQAAQPTYMSRSLLDRMPTKAGEVVLIDDATESVFAAQVRERDTPHGGDSACAADVELD